MRSCPRIAGTTAHTSHPCVLGFALANRQRPHPASLVCSAGRAPRQTSPRNCSSEMPDHRSRLRFNAFAMNCVSHIHHGQWVREDTRQLEYKTLDPWIELAQLLERGKFDALFLADVVGTYASYRG